MRPITEKALSPEPNLTAIVNKHNIYGRLKFMITGELVVKNISTSEHKFRVALQN